MLKIEGQNMNSETFVAYCMWHNTESKKFSDKNWEHIKVIRVTDIHIYFGLPFYLSETDVYVNNSHI